MSEPTTMSEVLDYCNRHREIDGFCWLSSACSGPTYSNLASDRPFPEGKVILRGGNHGSCRFVIDRER